MAEHAVRTDGADRVIEVTIDEFAIRLAGCSLSKEQAHLTSEMRQALYVRKRLSEAGIPLKQTFDVTKIEPAAGRLEWAVFERDRWIEYRWHP